jgi:hypothetical protein
MRFTRGDVRDLIVSSEIGHGPPVVALKSNAAAEELKDQLSRDFWGSSIFDFATISAHLRHAAMPIRWR